MGQTHDKAFKQEAIHLIPSLGKSTKQIDEDLGIGLSTLSRWCSGMAKNGDRAFVFPFCWIHTYVFWTLARQEKKLWQIGQGKKYLAHQDIRNGSTDETMTCHLWWTALRIPAGGSHCSWSKHASRKGSCI